ncbi:MFS transporter [Desulfotruncus alcoholivorax]|uniref:MFS transporter n=1 Tax=Desulfotruncus alcoholivorax TaxID=265477 RepID=UPI0004150D21|nr:MFS transporter [Desulfotruncus alcoholivorax]
MFNIIILGLTSLLTDIGSEMVYPLIPLFLVQQLGATPAVVGLIEGFAESLASLLKVYSGRVSDKLQRRKPLAIAGYASSAVAKILIIAAVSWGWVLAGRIGDRFGKGVRTAPRDAIIADSTDPDKKGKSFGLHRALDTAGAVTGVALAYYLFTSYHGNYRHVFIWSLVPAFLGVLVLALVREAKGKMQKTGSKDLSLNWQSLNPRLKGFLIVVFLFALGNSSNQFLLLRSSDLGMSTAQVILLYLVFNVSYALVSFPAGALSDKIGRRRLLIAGYLIYSAVYLGFARVHDAGHLWLLFIIYGLYNGITEGVEKALVADVAPQQHRATMLGLHATLVGIGLLPASLLAGLIWNYFGAAYTFYFGSVMGLLAALGLAAVLKLEDTRQAG